MKQILSFVIALLMAVNLSGCAPGQNTPGATVIGATAGGLLASQVFHGRGEGTGIVAGALIGGAMGYIVGRAMDRADHDRFASALNDVPEGREAHWRNHRTNHEYTVRPVNKVHYERRHRGYCREYQMTVIIDNRPQDAYGTACRQRDGSWKVVKSRS